MQIIDRQRLRQLQARELQQFTALHDRAAASMVAGVAMPWMARWAATVRRRS